MSQEKAEQPEYGVELKLAAVRRVLAGEGVSAVAQELGIRRKRLYVWKDRDAEPPGTLVARSGDERDHETDVAREGAIDAVFTRRCATQGGRGVRPYMRHESDKVSRCDSTDLCRLAP
jgi:transposase-like protein